MRICFIRDTHIFGLMGGYLLIEECNIFPALKDSMGIPKRVATSRAFVPMLPVLPSITTKKL